MSAPKHTPGPWEVWKGHAQVFAGAVKNTPQQISGRPHEPMPRVADCEDDEDLDEETQAANARLIAAAPELAEALLSFANPKHDCDDLGDLHDGCPFRLARAALKKAGVL